MNNGKKHITANLQKLKAIISFTILLFTVFFAACSTPTISSDDSDENNFSRRTIQDDNVSSSSINEGNGDGQSSSSKKNAKSSSSVEQSGSRSSTSGKVDCSALLDGKTGWSWDVPKECRFNPDIDYGTMTDDRDGKVYKIVEIGDQTWMAENLNFDPGQGGSGEDKYDWSWCYNDESKNCEVAGRLYTWAAAMDSVKTGCGYDSKYLPTLPVQGLCPKGWHLPTETEWKALFKAVGGQSTAGKELKTQSGWYSNGNGSDAFGFSALPVGLSDYYGDFSYDSYHAYFWSASENDGYGACNMVLNSDDDEAFLDGYVKALGFSVRCVKD